MDLTAFFCALIFATFAPEILKRSTLTIILIVAKMKKVKALLTSFMMVFVANAMFAQTPISITVNNGSKITGTTSQTFADILDTHSIAASDVTSLIISGPMKDGDIATLRTLTNMTTLDMTGVTLVPEGTGEPFVPSNPFITAVDSVWTTELGPIGQNAPVPHGITSATKLPSHIFDGMQNLQSVTIPTSVTTFGDYCFMNCKALTTVNNISRVTDLGGHTFLWCTSLQTFTIPDNVLELNSTFMGCTALTSVTFPATEKLTTIVGAFARCISFNLNNGAIPSTVRTIGDYAFFKCESLTKIVLPEAGLTSLGGFAFEYCKELVTVENFDKITQKEIPSYLFMNDAKLTYISFPDGITAVRGYAFNGCENMDSEIKLCEGLTAVDYQAFNNCKKLKFKPEENGTMLPTTLASIADFAFNNCKLFAGEIVYPTQTDNTIHDQVFQGTAVTSVTIPQGITTIAHSAFENAQLKGELFFPKSVTDIGYGSFAHNHGVTSIVVEGSDAGSSRDLTVGEWCFNDLSSLQTVTIGENIKNITFNARAFIYDRALQYFNIPKGATLKVGEECFAQNESLARVDFGEGASVSEIYKAGFAGCHVLANAEVNELIKNLTVLHEGVFKDCLAVTDLVIPSSVEWIFNDAFGGTGAVGHYVSLHSITVSRNEAPSIGYVDGTYTVGDEEQMKTEHPFGPEVVANPNMCEIRFTGAANNDESVESYRANPKFMEILTKTLNENDVTYSCVSQRGADVLLTRTMKSKWNSVVLPFAVSQAQLEQTFGIGSLAADFTLCVPAKEAFRFTVRGGIDPNHPVLVMPTKKHETDSDNDGEPDDPYHFVNVDIVGASVVDYPTGGNNGYIFTGTYNSDTPTGTPSVSAGSYFVYDNHFFSNGVANYTKAFRGWLAPVSGAAPRLVQAMAIEIADEDGETTMIGSVQDFTDKQTDHAFYTLDGRRVENPKNGIYIVNGKKVVIK